MADIKTFLPARPRRRPARRDHRRVARQGGRHASSSTRRCLDGNRQGRRRRALAVHRQGASSCTASAGDVIATGAALAEFELDPNAASSAPRPRPPATIMARRSRRRRERRRRRQRRAGKARSSPPTKAARSSRNPARTATRDEGTVVGAMQSAERVHVEQAASVGGVKAVPAVRALAKKLGVDLARVHAERRRWRGHA